MTKVIAFAGKGGTGKTTVAALLTRSLVRRGAAPVLAIDADAATNHAKDTGRNSFRRDDEQFDWSMRLQKTWTFRERYNLIPMLEFFNITNNDNFRFPACDELRSCFLGTFAQIPGEPTRVRLGMRFEW